ncbi:uncharacterized protein N7473_004612 [Penicillium subrubescens]|uniref:uncharacterized protein n=1 Tax=Penicillium subrubescens TaxID=1316194 RepID=UPI0025452569|nr:uncharacterized protein N7473_004612 [Penicillium subrubescens]KAJ5900542.1 hypothetical protein N7473_004612 [Penicillium subrubescens]
MTTFARKLASHILKRSDVAIPGYCHDPSKVSETIASSPKVTLIKGDAFDHDSMSNFVNSCDVVLCCYLGDDKLMVDGQKALIAVSQGPPIHVKAYLETGKVQGPHTHIGGFMEPIFSSFFNIFDPSTNTFRHRVLGGRATIREIAQSFEKVLGVKPTLESLSLGDLYKTMHGLRQKNLADVFSYMLMFFYYCRINGQTFVGTELNNSQYPDVKPFTMITSSSLEIDNLYTGSI